MPGRSGVLASMKPDDDDRWEDIARMIVVVACLVFFGIFANRYR
jgi:hypothetical protein